MKRWILAAALAAGLLAPSYADDPNPFRGGKADTKAAADKKDETASDTARVAHIKLAGDLDESPVPEESLFGPPAENFSMKLARIQKAAKDDRIKGLYLEIGELQCGF